MQKYTIQPNDTLYLIAKKFKIPLAQLIKANPEIANPNLIHIGQTITIPDLPPVLKQLDTIESNAEDIMDDIYAKGWQKAKDKVNIINTNMDALIPYLQQAMVPNNLITDIQNAMKKLEENVAQKNSLQALFDANQITRYIPDILDYFKVIIPTDVSRLDFLGRQIILNVEGNDWNSTNENYTASNKIWGRLKPEMNAKYSNDISDMGQILSALKDSISGKEYRAAINNANKMLDLVDVLETDFKQQNS
ncbi:MAG: LysM domain-containing protein [Massilibacteroides sp.]|nr:LysM domain-containing protein [Massilibacteroides sp.]